MQNIGAESFSYDTFKMAYDSDQVIQALTHRFDQNGVELKTKNTKDNQVTGAGKPSAVSKMAKRATASARKRA